MMAESAYREVRLADYRPPPFAVEHVDLTFELDAERTMVRSRLRVRRAASTPPEAPLLLDGRGLELLGVRVDGEPLGSNQYLEADGRLTLWPPGDAAEIEIDTAIRPAANTSGEGMFVLNGQIATQCEAEGFRRLTYFPDRPDVLAPYRVTLVGDRSRYPVLLSNGDLVASGERADGRHFAVWEDPHPKPSYIFAVMAGTWAKLEDEHLTPSGRRIELAIYADASHIGQCGFAMGALKRALRWEEEVFGLEYDLDRYNIVALTDHVGAMENKGLNLFEAHGIVADPATTTDDDYLLIERILAHEVFHNWTGNRVTCRDWFQLSVKEGLTRLRDQLFAQDMGLADFRRIDQVKALRRNQFPEDAGPAAHPVQPKHYLEIKNFYTATVYEKGAEVARMLYTLLGREAFVAGVRRYLADNDYQAVTLEAFLAAMAAESGRDLTRFRRWYDQAGRPVVDASGRFDPPSGVYELTLTQRNVLGDDPPPFHIPVAMGLIGASGRPLPCSPDGALARVLELTDRVQTFRFAGLDEPPVPSLFRGFSAPVSYRNDLTDDQLAVLMSFDPDPFSRWDASQQLGIAVILRLAKRWRAGLPLALPEVFADAFGRVLNDSGTDLAVLAELIRIPDEPAVSDGLAQIDLDAQVAARRFVCRSLADRFADDLLRCYRALSGGADDSTDPDQIARRRMKNACLELLLCRDDQAPRELALAQVLGSANMTDAFEALAALAQVDCVQRNQALDRFYTRWHDYPRVIDKWFLVQALARTPDAVDRVLALEQHPDMDPMNAPRAFAFYGSFFRQNRVAFHEPTGRGYDLLVDRLLFVDQHRPGASMRLMPQILQWRRYDAHRRELMRAALERLAGHEGLSRGLYENVTRALAAPAAKETP
ncbi:MAG: aminopeptidase N [Pseudomonadales bacterium]